MRDEGRLKRLAGVSVSSEANDAESDETAGVGETECFDAFNFESASANGAEVRWRRLAGIDVGNYGFEQMLVRMEGRREMRALMEEMAAEGRQ